MQALNKEGCCRQEGNEDADDGNDGLGVQSHVVLWVFVEVLVRMWAESSMGKKRWSG